MSRSIHSSWIRDIAAFVSMGLFALLFAACGGTASDGAVIRFWALGAEGDNIRKLIPEFERRNPGITVKVQSLPWTAAHEKLLTVVCGELDARSVPAREHLDPGVPGPGSNRRPALRGSTAPGRFRKNRSSPGSGRRTGLTVRSSESPGMWIRGSCFTGRIFLLRRDTRSRRPRGRNGRTSRGS